MKYLILYLICCLVISSCTTYKTSSQMHDDIDNIIEKYNSTDFSEFNNVFIATRQQTKSEANLIIHKFYNDSNNTPPYFVTVNLKSKKINDINRNIIKQNNIEDYYTDSEIDFFIKIFLEFNLPLIGVDHEGNVFINPFNVNEPPLLLRVKTKNDNKVIRNGFVYKHYKDSWYINSIYMDTVK